MHHKAIAAPVGRAWGHLPLGKSRVETLCHLMAAMVYARMVNLSHLASEMPSCAQIALSYRRLQRFIQYVRLDPS